MHQDVVRTATSNQMLYDHVGALRARVNGLEQENKELRSLINERSRQLNQRRAPKLDLAISNLAIKEKEDINADTLMLSPVCLHRDFLY